MNVRDAPFALRVVRRTEGDAAILYRRVRDRNGRSRLTRLCGIGALPFAASGALLRAAVRATGGQAANLTSGPFHPLDAEWGARVACYALVAEGLRDADRLSRAALHLQHADSAECAWWLGMMTTAGTTTETAGPRAVRALRILVEAVQ